ncbi:hypothetical protein AKJ16_DCAP05156 [Drosera capensis]
MPSQATSQRSRSTGGYGYATIDHLSSVWCHRDSECMAMYVILYPWILRHAAAQRKASSFRVSELTFSVISEKYGHSYSTVVLIFICNSGCNVVSQCCNSYEFCVSCCLNPSQTPEELAMQVKIARPLTAGTYASVFDFCAGRCRHNSESVVHENAYVSEFHHCFSLPSNRSDSGDTPEGRIAAINIFVGRQGESCDSTCKSRGLSCITSKLLSLNQCESMKKFMNCNGGCFASIGPDQPAEVADDAPKHLFPGACLYTKTKTMFTCDGFHQHTRRLCPCA